MVKLAPCEDVSIILDGMITEAMRRKDKSKPELSTAIGLAPETLTRWGRKKELWRLNGEQIYLIVTAAGRHFDFSRR